MNEVVVPQEDRTLALITHLSGIVAGFIVPLIIWLRIITMFATTSPAMKPSIFRAIFPPLYL